MKKLHISNSNRLTILFFSLFVLFVVMLYLISLNLVKYKQHVQNLELEKSEYVIVENYTFNNELPRKNDFERIVDLKNNSVCYLTAGGNFACLDIDNNYTKENIDKFQLIYTKYPKGIEVFNDKTFNVVCYQTAGGQFSCVQKTVENVR